MKMTKLKLTMWTQAECSGIAEFQCYWKVVPAFCNFHIGALLREFEHSLKQQASTKKLIGC